MKTIQMKKTIKLLKLLLAITSCLFFYSCTDSPAYFESASVTRTGGIAGSDNKAKNTMKSRIRGLNQASRNIADGSSMLNVASGYLQEK